MGTVVIHAGMGKTGSSSIQRWLRDHGSELHESAGVTPLSPRFLGRGGRLRLLVNRHGRLMNAGRIHREYAERTGSGRDQLVSELIGKLDRKAEANPLVVLSAERFAQWFWGRDEAFLARLDELAASHEVRVAYYVRPQHTALEAAWRQWGFREPGPPSRFLTGWCAQLDYMATLAFMREAAPRVRFEPRPFRRDLLAEGDVVVDFARTFLGLEPDRGEEPPAWRNTGLPLELVNALHGIPDGELWESTAAPDVNPVLERLRGLVGDLDVPETERIRRSRLILRQACHRRFEADNLRLISELGWGADEWVPGVGEDLGEASFERLDELWRPQASASELAILRGALAAAVEEPHPASRAGEDS